MEKITCFFLGATTVLTIHALWLHSFDYGAAAVALFGLTFLVWLDEARD